VENLKDFYSTTAQACFTVLSVWWVILSLNFKEWVRDPHRRLMVYDVSLYFLLPGLMSLVSLLAIGVPEIWRVAFALAGVVGAIESVVLPIRRRRTAARGFPSGWRTGCPSCSSA
jgi:predicted ferric reductase